MSTFVDDLRKNGYAIIEDFLTEEEIDEMKSEIKCIVYENEPKNPTSVQWLGLELQLHGDKEPSKNMAQQKLVTDGYHIQSVDKASFFYEMDAFDKEGNLAVDKERSVNKVAHGLHLVNPIFRKITFSEKVKNMVKQLGYIDPVVIQGMYIFKNPQVGGRVDPHQDSTYLHTFPEVAGKLLGFWFPLEDATIENGCLQFIPGSHKTSPHNEPIRRFIRKEVPGGTSLTYTGPEGLYMNEDFVPGPAMKRSCVIIDGLVVHKSSANNSSYPRPAYTFHIFDQHDVKWSPDNWAQPDKFPEKSFPSLYNN